MIRIAATFVVLLAVWFLFSGKTDAAHLSYGIISAALVTYLSNDMWFRGEKTWGQRLRELRHFPGYVLWLLWQIVLANVEVLKLALLPRCNDKMDPQMITYTTNLQSDFGKFILANSITLTPGTVTATMRENQLEVHAIYPGMAEGIPEMERRIAKVFEPKNEEALNKS